jgi:hypothetical protein
VSRFTTFAVAGCAFALVLPVSARAQESASATPENPRIQLGPLGLSPRISLTNVGLDTNVLNQSTNPQQDFTMTFVPGVDAAMHIGRGLLTSKTGVEMTYFAQVATERSIGLDQQGRFDLRLDKAVPYASAAYVSTYRRPNAEIDARVGQTTTGYGVGTRLLLGWRASVDVGAKREKLELEDVTFDGVNLATALDRNEGLVNVNLNVALTPLTTFVVKNALQQDRFIYSPERDTNSLSVMPGFEFKPSALISGSAFVGFRDLRVKGTGGGPSFVGAVAAVALSYTMRDTTRFDVKVNRDMDYSYETDEPYFLASGANLTLTQAVGGRWDALGRVGREHLDYQRADLQPSGRRDQVGTYGSGVGYHLDNDARIGFDVNYVKRLSPVASRHYSGFQIGGSFRYGF